MPKIVQKILSFTLLYALKTLSRVFFRHDTRWVGETLDNPWEGIRLVAILNHTSLFEPVFTASCPNRFLWNAAAHGVVPVAEKTINRPFLGPFFRRLTAHVVSITRRRDSTWSDVLERTDDPSAMVLLLPEGRMKRRNGLDSEGRPMTIRAGIADVLRAIPRGRFLLAYSGGLHHIQAPGDRLPRPFRTVYLKLECLEIDDYRENLLREVGEEGFTKAVIDDLTRRRDLYCHRGDEEVAA